MTNYEKIKSMSVEEMAEQLRYISRNTNCLKDFACPAHDFCFNHHMSKDTMTCKMVIKKWLKSEVTENDTE